MARKASKAEIKVTTRILPGSPVTQMQMTIYRKWWQKLIILVKKNEL